MATTKTHTPASNFKYRQALAELEAEKQRLEVELNLEKSFQTLTRTLKKYPEARTVASILAN